MKKADMPSPRSSLSTSVVNGKIYAIGGAITPKIIVISKVEVYNPVTNRWTKERDMPTPRGWLAASAVKGKIYVIGGSTGGPNGKQFSSVEEFHTGFAVNAKEKLPTLWGMLKAKN